MSALDELHGAVRNALTAASLPTAVIAIDVSFNEHLTADYRPHWVLHPRVYIPRPLDAAPERTLRQHFPPSDLIPRPLMIATFDGDLAGIAYGMKPGFERRQSYQQTKATAEGSRVCRNTRGRPLRGSDAVELAVYLDRTGLRRRLFLHGTMLTRSPDGAVVIRPTRRLREPGPARNR